MHLNIFFRRLFTCCYIIFGIHFSILYALPPSWVRRLPKAENTTYRYVMESATANTEQAAHDKALGRILQQTIMYVGLPCSSTQVELAIKSGTLQTFATEFKIPVNEVCKYSVSIEGGGAVRMYILCQVAVAGNIAVQFTEFRNCGNSGDTETGQTDLRPSEWALYESDAYFAAFVEDEQERGQTTEQLLNNVRTHAEKLLADDLHMQDTILAQQITTKTHRFQEQAYAVAFIPKETVIERYSDLVEDQLYVTDNLIRNADSYFAEGNIASAKASLLQAQEKLSAIDGILLFLNTYATSRKVENAKRECQDMRRDINEKMNQTAGNMQKQKEQKVSEYVQTAHRVLRKNMVGDGLRYLCAAQVVLAEMLNKENIQIPNPETDEKVNAGIYIDSRIKEILLNIRVTCDGYIPGSESEVKLNFFFGQNPIAAVGFYYNDNSGWSGLCAEKNGWSTILLSPQKPTSVHIKIDYRSEDYATFDPELPMLFRKYKNTFNYDEKASLLVNIPQKTIEKQSSAVATTSTSMAQNYVANRVMQTEHKVNSEDSTAYLRCIRQVCHAIQSKTCDDVYNLFTISGWEQFSKLLKYGQMQRVISDQYCRFVKIGDEVHARSIPMEFTFSKGKKSREDIVFVLLPNGKIDGVQFALEEIAARNIFGQRMIDETARLTLINFIENYKTAFALERLDYIKSIFADDAVIITGRMLQPTDKKSDTQIMLNNVVYTRMSKEQYITRLDNSFQSKEWINIKFGNTAVESSSQKDMYAITLLQDYSSSNYGDHGYLFLLVDAENPDKPIIRVRTWQPETAGNAPFSLGDYDMMTNVYDVY